MFLQSHQAPAWTSCSPHLQQDCRHHPLPMGGEGAEPIPDSLPTQHRVAEQGCKVVHLLEHFVQLRKAVCHTPHAWQALALTLPAWGRFKGNFTNLLLLQNHSSSFLPFSSIIKMAIYTKVPGMPHSHSSW